MCQCMKEKKKETSFWVLHQNKGFTKTLLNTLYTVDVAYVIVHIVAVPVEHGEDSTCTMPL